MNATMAELDRLNPSARGAGRPAVIKTIQFLDDDPTGILRAIAAAHAPGATDGYTVIESAEALAGRE